MSYESLRQYIEERKALPLNSSERRLALDLEALGANNSLSIEGVAHIIRAYNEISQVKIRGDPRLRALELELFGN